MPISTPGNVARIVSAQNSTNVVVNKTQAGVGDRVRPMGNRIMFQRLGLYK